MPFKIGTEEYTYDVSPPGTVGEPLPADPQPTSDIEKDPAPVDTTMWDLSKNTKTTLSQYLSDLTNRKAGSSPRANDFPIDHDPNIETSYTSDVNGEPAPLSDGRNSRRFAQNRDADGMATKSPAYPTLRSAGFDPGWPGPLDGNSMLPKWPTQPGQERYVSEVLKSNRFSSEKRIENAPLTYFDSTPDANGNVPSGRDPQTLTQGQLATIGTTLSLRSTIELNSAQPGFDPRSAGSEAAALLPGINQLLLDRVNAAKLSAKDILRDITIEGVPDADMISISPGGSWGQLNDVYDPWQGLTNVGMMAVSAGLTTAVLLVLTGFYAVLGGLIDKGNYGALAAAKDDVGRYTLGSYLSVPGRNTLAKKVFSLEALGIKPTRHPISRCTQVGAGAFFGVGDVGNLTGANVGKGLLDIAQAPGYNIIVARAIIRSGQQLSERIQNSFKGNGLAKTKAIFEMLDQIKNSKIMGAINVFSQLGDQILTDDDMGVDDRDSNRTPGSFSAASKSRIDGSLKLAWSSNRSPAMYLIPERLQADVIRGGVFEKKDKLFASATGPGVVDMLSTAEIYDTKTDSGKFKNGRFTSEQVEEFEKQLDAEYVPFYFHDLRTNEIISFHAFLSSLSDDYTAEWNSNDGFGRVEPVKIYKGTTRRLNLSFTSVSTSEDDFDEMWVKINKLVTLVYPQYSKGKSISTPGKEYSFTQPFSQLQAASPLIRLRVGDVVRSNYSKFALMRLFGYGDKGIAISGDKKDPPAEITYADPVNIEKIREDIARAPTTFNPQYTFYVSPGTYPLVEGSQKSTVQKMTGAVNNATTFNTMTLASTKSFIVKVKRPDLLNGGVLCEVVTADNAVFNDVIEHGINAPAARKYVEGVYRIPIGALKPTEVTYNKIVAGTNQSSTTTSQDTAIADFFNEDNNAVVKSFKEMGGKGLAGCIDTLNFDWLEATTWETNQGSRAPKMCKITISFSPIHDVSPGLDHNGFNRAPVYPIGRFMRT